MKAARYALLGACSLALMGSGSAWSQSVTLQGMMGKRALLIIDGGRPRSVAPGESFGGVRVLSTSADQAVVSVGGKQLTLRLGEAPASVGGAPSGDGGDRIVLSADSRGHFFTQGSINNRPVQFMVDTGASDVALGQSEADRLGIDYKSATPVRMNTANGVAQGWRLKLRNVKVGEVTLYDVDAVVTPLPMPAVLLGNSFLNRFNMRRDADQLTLSRR
ncbi:retropepsin-like aspartic protease family protein [Ottowia caeni]|uniref:retropepsin-like aspartic protease family protein n=1 Tax=Ottowia caeni TaxID=2870339 RepID=UPI003D7493DC|nr:retroviral-like aspartic protease family protein [Ottowia caeni]